MGCSKTGQGIYAGNNACENAQLAKKLPEGAAYSVQGGIPYATTKINVENMIPIGAVFGGASQVFEGFKQSKIDKALSGEKEYTAAQTVAGKFLGRLFGRDKAAQATEAYKAAQASGSLDSNINKNMKKQGLPVSGGVQFGTEANPMLKFAAIGAAVILGAFYFNSPKRRRRRRY